MKNYLMTINISIDDGHHPDATINDLLDQWQATPEIEGLVWDDVDWKEFPDE